MSVDIVGWEIFRTTNLPVVGAAVNVRAATVGQPNTSGIITAMNTNANGQYSFTGLTDGDYDIDITYAGVTKSYKGLTKFNGIVQPSNFQSVAGGQVLASPISSTGRPTFRPPSLTDFGGVFGQNLVVATPNGVSGALGFRNVVGADFGVGISGNTVFASPNGPAGAPNFRYLVPGDFGPNAPQNGVIAGPISAGPAPAIWRNLVPADFGTGVLANTFMGGSYGGATGQPFFRALGLLDIPAVHNFVTALGITGYPSSGATTATVITDMQIGPYTPAAGATVLILGWVGYHHDTGGAQARFYVTRDAVDILLGTPHIFSTGYQTVWPFVYLYTAETAAPHTYQLKFSVTAGTITFTSTYRAMFLIEMRR